MPSRRCPVQNGNAPGAFWKSSGHGARGTEAGTGEFEKPSLFAPCPHALGKHSRVTKTALRSGVEQCDRATSPILHLKKQHVPQNADKTVELFYHFILRSCQSF